MSEREFGARATLAHSTIGTPLAYAAAAVVLGMLVPRLESHFFPDLTAPASASAAIALLSAIASGMLPLTGLVFSLAFVMVQFSATAYSPRLVSWFAGSAMMSHSLGVFTATFVYSLGAIVWVDRGGTGKVPLLTLWFAIVLLLVSVVFFVLLVEKLAMLQISRVLAYAGDQGRVVIERDYPLLEAREGGSAEAATRNHELPEVSQLLAHRGGPAVIQAIDVPGLVALAAGAAAVVEVALAVGDTVIDGMPLLRVHGGARPLEERKLRRLVSLGAERTFEQDPKYAIRILVDIAIKALSPAINDPTTAVQALDQLEDLLLRLGRRSLAAGRARDASGSVRLVFPVPSWEDFLVLALDEIRYCGASSIQVMRRMRALLLDLMKSAPPERLPALERYLERVDNGIRRAFEDGAGPQGRSRAGPPGARPVAGTPGMSAGPSRPRYPSLYQLNTRVFLTALASGLGRRATLDDFPDAEIERLAALGFDWVWLLSVWSTGKASQQVSRSLPELRGEFEATLPDLREEDIAGSGFAITGYQVHPALGGDAALARLRARLARRGLKLMLDFVPNHTALDHPWVEDHPEYYVGGTELDLAREPRNFTRARRKRGDRVMAYGRDPYFEGWPDTLQLDYANPATRDAMTGEC